MIDVAAGTRVEVMSPEGVPIPFAIASLSDRAGALLVDAILQLAATAIVVALVGWAGAAISGWTLGFAILVAFLLRTFYFTWFELRWLGRTPGKRWLGIRIVDARGGPLTTDAILARNFTRELELWLPLGLLVAPGELWPGAPGWATLAAGGWVFLLASMPVWNRRRQRIGDLVAGTLVVREPRALLLPELATVAARHRFTDAQLDVYGVYELQVLEDVLRHFDAAAVRDPEALARVAGRIQRKIGWPADGPAPPQAFLEDFYAALRARLEARLLLGRRKADKHAR